MQDASAHWRRRSMPLLGTYVEIAVPARDEAQLRRWTDAAFARVAECHAAMSFHAPASDLAALARAGAGECVPVSADTWATLRLALELEAASGGLFNVAVAPELVRRGLLPAPAAARAAEAFSACAALRLEPMNTVRVLVPVWIDLGGIAKGAAVDAAIAALHASGAPAALVNAGGDLRASGAGEHTVWARNPAIAGGLLAIARLADGAFATSGLRDPEGREHIVDSGGDEFQADADGTPILVARHAEALRRPQRRSADGASPWPTRRSADGALRRPTCRSVGVAAPSCIVADALTKVVALAGPASAGLLRRYDAQAVWIDATGCLHHV